MPPVSYNERMNDMDERNLEMYNAITQKLLSRFSEDNKNVVLSPLSSLILLSILADATKGQTRDEIIKALGCDENAEEIVEWLASVQKEFMDSDALTSTNAVCIREDIKNKITPGYEAHLQELFGGKLFTALNMVDAVNQWVNEKTNGMIPKIADESMNGMIASLMNAIAFDAKWAKKYESDDIDPGEFHNADGSCSEVTMLISTERKYIEDSYFTGFTKPYKDVGFSFMALLPKKKNPRFLSIALNHINISKLFNSRTDEKVVVYMPEYTFEYRKDLDGFCKEIGIEKVFSDNADFSPMMDEWLKVEKILHKAKIQVDRNGTKAVAVTAVIVCSGCAMEDEYKMVELDRPFVFAIVHDATGLPAFVGVVNHLEDSYTEPESFEIEDVCFETEEEIDQYMKMKFHNIADRIHPDHSSLYDSSEEICELFAQAQKCYKEKNVYGIQIVEFNLNRLLDELGE